MNSSAVIRSAVLAAAGILLLAACSGTPVPQQLAPPPRPERQAPAVAPQRVPTDDQATERFLDQEIARRSGPPKRTVTEQYREQLEEMNRRRPTNEEATEIFLDHEIERRRYVPPAPPPERIVEREYVPVPDGYRQQYDAEYGRYRSSFPWHTAMGAGVGAVIGNQCGDSGRGAAIGAGIGFLFDLSRW